MACEECRTAECIMNLYAAVVVADFGRRVVGLWLNGQREVLCCLFGMKTVSE